MKSNPENAILQSCLQVSGPRRELAIASLGCLLGSTLLLLALQFFQDANQYLDQNEGPKNYFTLNKKVQGGALVNLGKKDSSFSPAELETIRSLEGVKRIGGFVRNQFPITVYIWPSGKVGMGSAAKADLFFESIPDDFLDFIPEQWNWEENASFVPIMVPKFYLDLWNFGLAPSRVEYPTLSMEAATGMPIEIFIGQNREATLNGRFIAFSKRINSVLVPESFLTWANQKFGQPNTGDFFFLWKKGSIDGPPRSRAELIKMSNEPAFASWEVSPLGNAADRVPASSIVDSAEKIIHPSRIILEVVDSPSASLLQFIEENGYELNREFPKQDLIKKAISGLFLGMGGIGGLLSLLSISTFATSYRLVVTRAAEHARNLLLLGFSRNQVSQIFFSRFLRLFFWVLGGSFILGHATKHFLLIKAAQINLSFPSGFSPESLILLGVYGVLFCWINKKVIEQSVIDLIR